MGQGEGGVVSGDQQILRVGFFIVRKGSGREEQIIFTWMCSIQPYTLDSYSERGRLLWRVYCGGHCIVSCIFVLTWLLSELIQGCVKEKQKTYAARSKTIHSTRAYGLKCSWKCMPGFPTRVGCIKTAELKNYCPASGFVCMTWLFPD